MIVNPRQKRLLEEVRAQGSMSIEKLAQLLKVTPQTVRRDVGTLAEAGLILRFHGTVAAPSSTIENIGYGQRQILNVDGKRRIARAVAREVPNGCSMIIDIGTTTEEVARALRHHQRLRVVTNDLNVAAILSESESCEVIVACGIVRSRDRGIVGEATTEFIRQFRVDIGLIGISSIEPDGTLRDFDYREVRVARAIIEQSRKLWLVADATKFSRRAMVELAHLSQVDTLFTDEVPPPSLVSVLADSGGRYVVAD